MRAAWRIAIDWLAGKPLRTTLLTTAVALASSLIVAVSSGVASVNAAFRLRAEGAVGSADLRLERVGAAPFGHAALTMAQSWPEVVAAAPRTERALPLRNPRTGDTEVAAGRGVDPALEQQLHDPPLLQGRWLEGPDEIVLDASLARRLRASVGDELLVERFGPPTQLRVAGIAMPSPLGEPLRPPAYLDMDTLSRAFDEPPQSRQFVQIDLALQRGVDPIAFAQRMQERLPAGLLLRPTARILANVDRNLRANQLGLLIVSIMAFLAASFIILTGLTTSVGERLRELGMLRCLGASRAQLLLSQLLVGAAIGAMGGAAGTPAGLALAWVASLLYREQLTAGLRISPLGVALGLGGAATAGLLAAVAPAVIAARVPPLRALASRARPPSRSGLALTAALGLALVLAQLALARLPDDPQLVYWLWALVGAPAMFTGYFLLGVPTALLTTALASAPLSRLLRIPRGLLRAGALQTPYRHGFTAGSLLLGLAIMVSVWTDGQALLRDWIGAIRFPDAFVHALRGMSEEDRAKVDALPFVEGTSAVTLLGVRTTAFGVRALRDVGTTFVAFEPEPFFRMTTLRFVEGDQRSALAALREGGAVLVAREFQIARGLHVGDTITLFYDDRPYTFTIAGVVESPGLDIASRYFEIGQERQRLALHAVFGSQEDLHRLFGVRVVHLLQIDLADDVQDSEAIARIRQALGGTLLAAGSGREIKERIRDIGARALGVLSAVAVAAIVIASLGAGSVIAAGVRSRSAQLGVLRTVGAEASLLRRAILAEALLLALAACLLGTAMGVQASLMSNQLNRMLAGLSLRLIVPVGPVAAGWAVVVAAALLAAAGPAVAASRKAPRALLQEQGS